MLAAAACQSRRTWTQAAATWGRQRPRTIGAGGWTTVKRLASAITLGWDPKPASVPPRSGGRRRPLRPWLMFHVDSQRAERAWPVPRHRVGGDDHERAVCGAVSEGKFFCSTSGMGRASASAAPGLGSGGGRPRWEDASPNGRHHLEGDRRVLYDQNAFRHEVLRDTPGERGKAPPASA